MRTINILDRRSIERANSVDAELIFVKITHPQVADVIRLVLDGYDYVIDGETWNKSAFELDLLTDSDRPPTASFRFPNVDREKIGRLRSVNDPCRVEFYVYSSAYFDLTADPRVLLPAVTLEAIYTAKSLFLTEISADDSTVEGTLRSWDYRQEAWPDSKVTKKLLPGTYAR